MLFNREITDINDLSEDVVYIATGGKSGIRDRLFGEVVHIREPHRVVACSYRTQGPKRLMLHYYPTVSYMKGAFVENIQDVSVHLLWEVPYAYTDRNIKERVNFWINVRGDAVERHSIKLKVYNTIVYHSVEYAKMVGAKRVYLIGDAAAGVPYFRSLQQGLQNLSLLGQDVIAYNTGMEDVIEKEETLAMVKSSVSSCFALGIHVSHYFPTTQWVRFSKEKCAVLSIENIERLDDLL